MTARQAAPVTWSPGSSRMPWQDRALLNAATDLVDHVREWEPADLVAELVKIDPQVMAALLVVLAALVPDSCTVGELLAWARPPAKCPSGEHWMTPDNTALQLNGRDTPPAWRCRACQRARVAARRARERAAS